MAGGELKRRAEARRGFEVEEVLAIDTVTAEPIGLAGSGAFDSRGRLDCVCARRGREAGKAGNG